jgi:[glutamine synthetase] adenylyltransferase / [glutamine synthetase]-adenylyl-L-tyrosine phosphorylase
MSAPALLRRSAALPAPSDLGAAEAGFARWREASAEADATLADIMRELADDAAGRGLLAALFGNSPFLTQCCISEPQFLERLLAQGPDATFAQIMAALDAAGDEPALMASLRRAKRRVSLLVALADIAALWPLETVTASLSRFADRALELAVRHLLRAAAEAGEIEPSEGGDPAPGSGFVVLGLGKLGAFELNYSSDVDLILLYDAERVRYRGRRGVQRFFARLAHDLQRLMSERTADGYVFRTDLRLRPDPASTPPAVSIDAALAYYESAGQNWERAALVKARVVAGDRAAGERFLAELTPFLWRKHLDFAAIQDIHSIKRQIDAHGGGRGIKVAGHNVKLGRGGIREVEFFAQTQQLIWGGREPELRAPGTCDALAALARAGRITAEAAGELEECYRFLRRVEHRLQMVNDAQTHSLPDDPEGLRRIALFLGYADAAKFAAELTRILGLVERHYAHLFEEAPTLAAPAGNLVFTGIEDDPDTLLTLKRLGFADPPSISAIVRGWHHGRYRATRSQRARELLTELVPAVLEAFGKAPDPDIAFVRFDQFLGRLPAGVQLFSLFTNNPPLIALMAEIMAAGPRLADEIARRPNLLDGVLAARFFDALPPREDLARDLGYVLDRAAHYEDLLDRARRWTAERKFQVGLQLLRRRLDGEGAGAAFADIAEAALGVLLPRVEREFAKSHGRIEGGALAVVGLGKLGSREMTATSDLDLILIYDAPLGVESVGGPHPLHASTYYARLAQRYINALTALTAAGNLYEVDMRLRPSGTQGPLATSLAAFRRYNDELAWTWERMSLTRARAVAGSAELAASIGPIVHDILVRKRDPDRLVADVDDMRRRISESHRGDNPLDLKHRRGGMVDIEFIAQYLMLREAASHGTVLRQNTRAALMALGRVGALPEEAAQTLIDSLMLWRDLQGLMKLTVDEPFDEERVAPALGVILGKGGGFDFSALAAKIEERAAASLALYERIVAGPAEAARRRIAEKEHAT